MNTKKQTVYVIDDDEAVRDALRMLLRAAGMHVEIFSSATAFLKDYRSSGHDCLILDVRMPGMSGLTLQEELYKRRIQIPIIFLTGHADVSIAVQALKKGAFDFIEKPLDSQRLVLAVLNALKFSDQQHSSLQIEENSDVANRLGLLSKREREVLDLVLAGKQTRVIAEQLNISTKTVEFHRARIRTKMGVASLAELFQLFITTGE